MGMFNRIMKRTKEDKGNAVILLGIMLIMVLLLVGGLLLDVSKAYQLKSSYVDSARKATQAAIMEQTPDGYLKPEAAGQALYVYENVARAAVVKKGSYFSKCEDYGDSEINIKITFIESKAGSNDYPVTISRSQVFDSDGKVSLTSKLGLTGSVKRSIINGKYESIRLDITEGTENVILPGAFAISQASDESKANAKCQKMAISAKANVFVGRTGQFD